ncbi:MAG TPA: VOC family protein [Gaiellaceae bacterium]|nr:VOC family protein [Gaiellaceae bacterium]
MSGEGLTTCLWFDGQAEEAAKHYVAIFEDAELGDVSHTTGVEPGAKEGDVLTVGFSLNGQKFLGLNGGPEFTFNEAISFQVFCADQEQVDYYWSRLSEGGEEGPCGWLKAKFGVSWQVVPAVLPRLIGDPDREKATRVTEAMLRMGKLKIAELEKAHAGS